MRNSISTSLSKPSLLPAWFTSEQGQALIAEESAALKTLIPDQYYRLAVQFGLQDRSVMQSMSVEQSIYCDIGDAVFAAPANAVISSPEALPFAESSVDLCFLFHTLDYCDDPHRVLREVSQMLSPEGVLLVSGFHPYSLWGLGRQLAKKQAPFDARFISRGVVQDWLELLGFQTLTACMVNYQFAQLNESWRARLDWMNKAGDRWWPTLGAVYMLVVKKQIYGGLHSGRVEKQQKKWFPAINPAPAKVLQRRR